MDRRKNQLSKNLLQMKFMQRRGGVDDDKNLQLPNYNPNFKVFSETDRSNYHFESSFETIENLRFGRMSFKGMNVEIERLQDVQSNGDNNDEEEGNFD